MPYSIVPVEGIDVVQLREIAGNDRFITHAHNPCMVGILERTFGWKGSAFVIKHNDIPAGFINCLFINGRLVSMPHFSFGGILTSLADRKSIYAAILPLLYNYFIDAQTGSIPFLVRDRDRISDFTNDTKVISWLDLSSRSIENIITGTQMAKAVKASASGLNVISGGKELFRDFYFVYSRNMLRLGSPVLPKKLFSNILDGYSDGDVCIFCVYKDKAPIGASFLLSYLGFFENTWFSTLQEFNKLFPAQLLHVEMIRFALKHKGHTYSFGRSTSGSGVHEFKRRWKTEETTIFWNYDKPLKLDFRKAEFLTRIWRLLPLSVANSLGPVVGKGIY
jgi:hypothetical protein